MSAETRQFLQYALTPEVRKEGKRFELKETTSGLIRYVSGKVGDRLYRLFQMHREEGLTSEHYNCHGLTQYLQGNSARPEFIDALDRSSFREEATPGDAADSFHFPIGVHVFPGHNSHSGTLLGRDENGKLIAIQKFGHEPLSICDPEDILSYGAGVQPNFFGKRKLTLRNIKRALGVG